MQKKILLKTAREYLQNSFPENLFPVRKLRNTKKKFTFSKSKFSKIQVIRAKNEIFNQYAYSTKNMFVKEQSLVLNNNVSFYNPKTFLSNTYRNRSFLSENQKNNKSKQTAALAPFLFSINQIQYELAKRKERCSDFKNQLKERKKLALIYGLLSKKYIKKTIKQACLLNGKKSDNFFFLLEKRLDIVLFKACFFQSIKSARQWINHGKILVNNKCVNTCSFTLKPGDIISIKQKDRIKLCKKIKYSLKNQILKKKQSLTLKQQSGIFVISMALFNKLKNSFNSLKLSLLFIKSLMKKSKVSNTLECNTTNFFNTLKQDLKPCKSSKKKNFISNFSYDHFISEVKEILGFKLKVINEKFRSAYTLSKLDGYTLRKNLIELNLIKTKVFVNLTNNFSVSKNKKVVAANKEILFSDNLKTSVLDKKSLQSLRAFLTHLKLKKIFCKNYKKVYNYSILYQNTLKPINLEISYKNLVIIYLYSPQKISFPCSVDINLIVLSLA